MQIDAVLGDDEVDVVARHHARALFSIGTMRLMAPSLAVAGSAMIGTPPGERGRAVDEVELTAHATVKQRSDGVRTHLPRQIHLQGRVDAHLLGVLRDDEGSFT